MKEPSDGRVEVPEKNTKNFFDVLYVVAGFQDEPHYAYSTLDDIDEDVTVGVYELVKIQKVKVTTTKSLEDIKMEDLKL